MKESPDLVAPVLAWYGDSARVLPWRAEDRTPWEVFVSEIMLQQTPVSRVLPIWTEWLRRWPTPTDLAGSSPADAIRAWQRLGYPRRALRLREAAIQLRDRFGGEVPASYEELRSLPGVGDYTASAVLAFAFRQRSVVLDTNVRRVLARVATGSQRPHSTAPTAAERALAEQLLPADADRAATWSVAVMELGALICRTGESHCHACPVRLDCKWRANGYPAAAGAKRTQKFAGTDRQARGRILGVLRDRHEPIGLSELAEHWPQDRSQFDRAIHTLIEDGLVEPTADSLSIALPEP